MNIFKKIFFSILFIFFVAINFAQKLPDVPVPMRFVNDYTGTLTQEQIQALENKLFNLAQNTSTEVAVVIIKSTEGVTISDYNVDLLRKWGVGSKKNNNGVILLIAKEDKKLDITVGYGLEGSLTDATSLSIIEDIIVPQFKGNDYYRGVNDGVEAIVQAVQGKYNDKKEVNQNVGEGSSSLFILIFILILLFIFLSRRGGGGSGGAFMSRRGQRSIADAIFWNTVLGGGGGSGWSGGGGGGWSGGGGGFGGFGGGSGGGGGASGSW